MMIFILSTLRNRLFSLRITETKLPFPAMFPLSLPRKSTWISYRSSRSFDICSKCSTLAATNNSLISLAVSRTNRLLSLLAVFYSSFSSLLIEKFLEKWWWPMSLKTLSVLIWSLICPKSFGWIEMSNSGRQHMDAAFSAIWSRTTASTRQGSERGLSSSSKALGDLLMKLIAP